MDYQNTRDAVNGTQGMRQSKSKIWLVQVDGITVFSSGSRRSVAAKARHIRENFAFGREVKIK